MTLSEIEHTLELSSKYDCPVQIHAAESDYGVLEIKKTPGQQTNRNTWFYGIVKSAPGYCARRALK